MKQRIETSMKSLGHALDRLEELIKLPISDRDYLIDATIQRFEFVMELFWKTLKHCLRNEGKETTLPKQALQEAFAANWIEDEALWIKMMRDRNLTSHTYREEYAQEIYQNIKSYYPEMRKVYKILQSKFP